jgi:hypothetical protein
MAKRLTAAPPILLVASTGFALARPNNHVRAGANHHLGDDSFVAKYGHNVDAHASERGRMHQHLQYVRDWLASRPAGSSSCFSAWPAASSCGGRAATPKPTPSSRRGAGVISSSRSRARHLNSHSILGNRNGRSVAAI